MHYHFFAKRRGDNRIRLCQRREDVTGNLAPQRREEQRLARQRHTATYHYDLRGDERYRLPNGPAERLQRVSEDALCDRVAPNR